jgi:hypothetical protein
MLILNQLSTIAKNELVRTNKFWALGKGKREEGSEKVTN